MSSEPRPADGHRRPGRWILVLDFGSQYTQLIARRIRELRVYCEIHPFSLDPATIRGWDPAGIVLSGGPSSVYDEDAPHPADGLLEMRTPILGICYGMHLLAQAEGAPVRPARSRNSSAKTAWWASLMNRLPRRSPSGDNRLGATCPISGHPQRVFKFAGCHSIADYVYS